VPCLAGETDSGKTSLFHPILGLIQHSNVATVTKQKVFNKAMIYKQKLAFNPEVQQAMDRRLRYY